MRIALASDEPHPVNATVARLLEERGHEVVRFDEGPWAEVAERAAMAVAAGECDEGVLFCWSGTGISMAANKVAGVRAALCGDPGAAAAARVWNHANVLCLANRTLSDDMAKEILAAWFDTAPGERGKDGVAALAAVDARHRAPLR
jgi:ribose 5-phosphate isomerase B